MKVTTFAMWKSMNDFCVGLPADAEQSFEYIGPVAKLDRAAQAAAKNLGKTEQSLATEEGAKASAEEAQVAPFFAQEMKAEHGFTPGQRNEILTAEMSGLGGAAGATDEAARLQAARTRNASGFTKALDEAARDRAKIAAGGAEQVAAQDVTGAIAKNAAGAAGLTGLYGTDLGAQEKAMGLQNEAINSEIEAGRSGWLQNMNATITSLSDAAKAAAESKQAFCWIAAATYNGWDDPRTSAVRNYLLDWKERSLLGAAVVALYKQFGERIAEAVKVSPLLKRVFRNLFDIVQ